MDGYIRVCDVEKYYGTASNVTKAVDRVTFQVEKGEFVGGMGASGSGKTTLLNLLATIDQVTSGHIYYEDVDITELPEEGLARFCRENFGVRLSGIFFPRCPQWGGLCDCRAG